MQNESLATLLARLEGILGAIPDWMLQEGCFTHRYLTASGVLYDQNEKTASFSSGSEAVSVSMLSHFVSMLPFLIRLALSQAVGWLISLHCLS